MLDLIKDHMRLSYISVPESQSTSYEYDCIIPDILPDMARILAADASVETGTVSAGNGSANVNLKINYKILYMPDSAEALGDIPDAPEIKAFTAVSEHIAVINSDNINENTTLRAVCRAEEIESNYINSRKIVIRTNVRIIPFILNTDEEGICTGISGLDDIQQKKRSVTLSAVEDSVTDSVIIDEDIELSGGKAAYKELLRTDAILSDVSYTVSDGLQIKGSLETCTLYVSDDSIQSVQIIENEIPFTHSIEVLPTDEDTSWRANFVLKRCKAEVCQDSDGESRILHIEAEIGITADAYTAQSFELLDDAYSLTQNIALEKSTVSGMIITDDINGQFVLRDSSSKSDDQPDISQIVNVTAMLGEVKTSVEDGRIITEGEIICRTLYMSDNAEQPASSFTTKIPFTQSFDSRPAKAGMTVYTDFDVHHVSFNIMSPSEIELRISVSAKLTVIKQCDLSVINGVSQPDDPYIHEDADAPAILLYVVQPGDTLWKIAKRYNAPLELLKEVNQLKNPDLIMPGQKLLIPR